MDNCTFLTLRCWRAASYPCTHMHPAMDICARQTSTCASMAHSSVSHEARLKGALFLAACGSGCAASHKKTSQLHPNFKIKSRRRDCSNSSLMPGHGSHRKQRNGVAYHAGIVAPPCPQLNVAPIPGDGALVAGDGCGGLEGHADHDVLSVGDAALDTSRPAAAVSGCQKRPVHRGCLPASCKGCNPGRPAETWTSGDDWNLRSPQVADSTHAALVSRLMMSPADQSSTFSRAFCWAAWPSKQAITVCCKLASGALEHCMGLCAQVSLCLDCLAGAPCTGTGLHMAMQHVSIADAG